jgi:hypothetical protein
MKKNGDEKSSESVPLRAGRQKTECNFGANFLLSLMYYYIFISCLMLFFEATILVII